MTDAAESKVVITAGTSARVSDVDKQLTDLWAKAAEGNSAVMRATTLNLIIYAAALADAEKLLSQIAEQHPCRTILITIRDQADAPLEALPAILSKPSFGREVRSQVWGEQITLSVGRDNLDRVPAAVQSLLLTDQPVYMLWEGLLTPSDPVFNGICDAIEGLIVDSASFEDGDTAMRSLLALLEWPRFTGHLTDLNWSRVLSWCNALSEQFNTPDGPSTLSTITRVEIEHTGSRSRALLLLGWLADRLKWRIVSGNQTDEWSVRTENGLAMLALRNIENPVRALHKVTIDVPGNTFVTENVPADNVLLVHLANQSAVRAKTPADKGALLGMALDASGPDRLYERALRQAATLGLGVTSIEERAGLLVAQDADALNRLAARELLQIARYAVRRRGRFTLALSGGSTPKALYELLTQAPYVDQIPWPQTHLFWGDERNVPIDSQDSNQRMAREALISRVPIPAENVHGLLTGQVSAEDAAARYADELRAFFGVTRGELVQFDLILLGLGDDGHTASLFPHSPALKAKGSDLFVANPVQQLSTTRLTFTAETINNAVNVIFLVAGEKKADILYEVLRGPYKPDDHPSQRIHPTDGLLTFIVDQTAAAKLRKE